MDEKLLTTPDKFYLRHCLNPSCRDVIQVWTPQVNHKVCSKVKCKEWLRERRKMYFTEQDTLPLKSIRIQPVGKIGSADRVKLKAAIDRIKHTGEYEPITVRSDPDKGIFVLVDGLETYMALWRLEKKKVNCFIQI